MRILFTSTAGLGHVHPLLPFVRAAQNRGDEVRLAIPTGAQPAAAGFGVPLVPFQLYNVDDGTGEITVVSRASRSPVKGSRVQVKGKVSDVAVFGGRSIGLHTTEDDRDIDD